MAVPTVSDVRAYIGETNARWDDAALTEVLASEAAAQAAVARIPADPTAYPDDLRSALLRRVQRALALRALPLAVLTGDAEAGTSTILPGRDPEVRRLEAPHRKLVVG